MQLNLHDFVVVHPLSQVRRERQRLSSWMIQDRVLRVAGYLRMRSRPTRIHRCVYTGHSQDAVQSAWICLTTFREKLCVLSPCWFSVSQLCVNSCIAVRKLRFKFSGSKFDLKPWEQFTCTCKIYSVIAIKVRSDYNGITRDRMYFGLRKFSVQERKSWVCKLIAT